MLLASRDYRALLRIVRDYIERSNIPWSSVKLVHDYDDEGRALFDDKRAEFTFRYNGRDCGVVIESPSDDPFDGSQRLPLGKLAGRCGEKVIKGPIDQSTWDRIAVMITSEDIHA